MYADSPAAAGLMHDPGAKTPPKKVRTMIITHHPASAHKPEHLQVTHHHTHGAHPAAHHEIPIHQGMGQAHGLDGMHDHIEDAFGQPNAGEAEAEAGEMGE